MNLRDIVSLATITLSRSVALELTDESSFHHVPLTVPYTMGKQVSFDIVAKALYKFFESNTALIKNPSDVKWIVSVLSAFVASIFACIFSQPGDMILTDTYKSKSGESFFGVIRGIYQKGGIGGFFTGTGARIIHVSSIITSQLVIYDIVKQALGLPATGSH